MQPELQRIQRDLRQVGDALAAWAARAGQELEQPSPDLDSLSLDGLERSLAQLEAALAATEAQLAGWPGSGELEQALAALQAELAQAQARPVEGWQAATAELEARLQAQAPPWDTDDVRRLVGEEAARLDALLQDGRTAEQDRAALEREAADLDARQADLRRREAEARHLLQESSDRAEMGRALGEVLALAQQTADVLARLQARLRPD